MDRKKFISTSVSALITCCGATLSVRKAANYPKSESARLQLDRPCDDRIEFAKAWVKRLMDVLDSDTDEVTRLRIMEGCGRACYRSAHGEPKEDQKMDLDDFLEGIRGYVGAENCYREENTIHFRYAQVGESTDAEKLCLCPIVEDGPENLSHTFCQCSVGYLREMFGRVLGYKPEIELLESVRRGGSQCRFEIYLQA